jgi:hypothetical protein
MLLAFVRTQSIITIIEMLELQLRLGNEGLLPLVFVRTLEVLARGLVEGESVIKYPSLLNVLKYTYDHRCY